MIRAVKDIGELVDLAQKERLKYTKCNSCKWCNVNMSLKSVKKELGEKAVKHVAERLLDCGCDICMKAMAIWEHNSKVAKLMVENQHELLLEFIPYSTIANHLQRRKERAKDATFDDIIRKLIKVCKINEV